MADRKLESVQVIWNAPNNPELPPVALVTIPDEDDDRYYASWGACNSDFQDASADQQIGMFLAKFIDLVVNDGVDAKQLHEIFSQVPEYRRALANVGGFDPEKV